MNNIVDEIAEDITKRLESNYFPGFGIMPSSDPKSNYYNQLWSRDFAHAAGNYFTITNPQAVVDSLRTIFKYQRADGALPFRVERQYLLLRLVPGLRFLAWPLFALIERKSKGWPERPVYEGQDFSGAEDTVPVILISIGKLFENSKEGEEFVKSHIKQVEKAVSFFKTKIDPDDGLAFFKNHTPDWADSINRGGKLSDINIWWAQSLKYMRDIYTKLGQDTKTKEYGAEFEKVKKSILQKLYSKDGYFKATEADNRIDAVASIFGAMYLLDSVEAEKVEQTLTARLATVSGLKNFDPPYPADSILMLYRTIGHQGYHNEYVWPWVTCQNIFVKIKIALEHPDEFVRAKYKEESVQDLLSVAQLFHDAGGAYEIFHENDCRPAIEKWYNPPRNFMGSMVGFQSVYIKLKKLGWLNSTQFQTN